MPKILLLHGYGQNAAIFYKKVAAIRKQCGKDCEFVHVEAPTVLKPVDLPQNLASIGAIDRQQNATSSASAIETLESENLELIPRGWWLRDRPETMHKCVSYFVDLLKEHEEIPFDGVLGFSQGACAAALLTIMLENSNLIHRLLGSSQTGSPSVTSITHPRLKFCILVAGFRPRFIQRGVAEESQVSAYTGTIEDEIQLLFDKGIYTPTLHILGENDQIVGRERSQTLIDACNEETRRIERHEGGHFVPSKTSWRQFFARYIHLENHVDSSELPSPNPLLTEVGTGSGMSTPGLRSGAITPKLDPNLASETN
ncbi:hypothetical protein FRC14_000554 [Serendipita sp. 396]|nr:hypothetical protein FRC14_000554 [Serendipita sp. 396]KAG8876890.1 hypothetical protein FRC20_000595 [Serendipita sp. 405]